MVDELIARTIEPCKVALRDADLKASDIDDILLVGGQTRMPKVQEVVKDFFGREPSATSIRTRQWQWAPRFQGGVLGGDFKRMSFCGE
ncbi:MAG: hypothetical protein Ct9H300mP13_0700 [Gammaproteobacteria bacterium]|nr:MAG: hypothetical protein Ct9H300mP13_0700 [Gammaproteobacteria bacterium]